MDTVLQAHLPYPAFAVDRHWNVVLSNSAPPQLYEGCSAEMLRLSVNAVRLVLHPEGMGPRILNYEEWRAHTLHLLRNQLEMQAELALEMLFPADDEAIEMVAEMERERSLVGSAVQRQAREGPRA